MRSHIKYTLPLILALALLIPLISLGRPFRINSLPDNGQNFSCGTCHVNPAGGGVRNPFGKDWETIAIPNGDEYVPALANKDSDGDGAINDAEFKANTNPGDPNSKPETKSVEAKGKKHIPWGKIRSGETQ
jgi:hypothetical protein